MNRRAMSPGELYEWHLETGEGLEGDEMMAIVDAGITEEEAFVVGEDGLWYCVEVG
jgi:hypothetical protein